MKIVLPYAVFHVILFPHLLLKVKHRHYLPSATLLFLQFLEKPLQKICCRILHVLEYLNADKILEFCSALPRDGVEAELLHLVFRLYFETNPKEKTY